MKLNRLALKKSTARKIEKKSVNQIRAWAGLGSASSPFMPSRMKRGELAQWAELKINRRFFQATTSRTMNLLKIKDKRLRATIQKVCQDIAAEESMGRISNETEAFDSLVEILGTKKQATVFLRTLKKVVNTNYKAYPRLAPIAQ
ncbi:MAG: hypothetical protein WCW13_03965 [archaeon]|jgi:hypothetical protein